MFNRTRFYAKRAAQQTALEPTEGLLGGGAALGVEEFVRAVLTDATFQWSAALAATAAGVVVAWSVRFVANFAKVKDDLRRSQLERQGAAYRRQLAKIRQEAAEATERRDPMPSGALDTSISLQISSSDVDEYCDDAAALWHTLIPAFETHGFWGKGSSRDGLRGVVGSAPWPDEAEDVDLDKDPAGVMAEGALAEFCMKVTKGAGAGVFSTTSEYLDFDKTRRRIARRFQQWSTVAASSSDRAKWLRAQLGWPYHSNTLKLQWYLEVAVAEDSDNPTPGYERFRVLRDALNAAPVTLFAGDDGYMSSSPATARPISEIETLPEDRPSRDTSGT